MPSSSSASSATGGSSSSSKKYGDLVAACGMAACFFPTVVPDLAKEPDRPLGYVMAALFIWNVVWGFLSWCDNPKEGGGGGATLCSVLACSGNILTVCFMNAFNFPRYDDSALVPETVWILVVLSANLDQPFPAKAAMGATACAAQLWAARVTPLLTIDDLPRVARRL